MQKQVHPYFGSVPLNKITNAVVREWVSNLLSSPPPAKPSSPCGNAWLLPLLTNAFRSIPRVPYRFLPSAKAAALSIAR
jgi:hypothetical protein